jgi:hypothetical protein
MMDSPPFSIDTPEDPGRTDRLFSIASLALYSSSLRFAMRCERASVSPREPMNFTIQRGGGFLATVRPKP